MFITGFLNCVLKFRISLMQTCKEKKRKKILNLQITESWYVCEKKLCICSALQLKTSDYWILPRLKRKKILNWTSACTKMHGTGKITGYWISWFLNPDMYTKKKLNLVVNENMRLLEYWLLNPDFSKKRKNMLKLLITEPPHVQGGQFWKLLVICGGAYAHS